MRENKNVRKRLFSLLPLFAGLALVAAGQDKKPEDKKTEADAAPAAEVKPPPVSLGELSVSLEGLVSRVRPAVVQIFSTGYATAD